MNLLFAQVLFILIVNVYNLDIYPNYDVNMILDVLNSYQKPTSIVLNVCWKQTMKRHFVSKLEATPTFFQFLDGFKNLKENLIKNDLLLVSDMTCSKSAHFLQEGKSLKMFSAPYRWLILTNQNDFSNFDVKMQEFNILADSDIILAEKNYNGFNMIMPYKILVHHVKFIYEEFGTWTPSNGLKKVNKMTIAISMRRKNFCGIQIATSFVVADGNSTKTELDSLKNIHLDTLSKTGYRQIRHLYDFINVTNVNVFSDTWGYLINGTWTGMIGNIVRGEAELTGTVTFLTTHRQQVLDFLSYPSPPTARFVFRQPSLSYQNNLFLLPFKPTVWFCIINLIVILAVIIYINAKWETKKALSDPQIETTLRPNVSDIAIMIIGAISQQGSFTELKGTLGRLVMFLLFIAFVFLYTSYSANIIVLLQSTSNQIRTLTDLYNSKLELGSEDTPYNRHLFSTATEPIRKAIYQNKIAPRGSKSNFMSLDEGVKKMQTQPFAFNMNLGTGYKAIEKYFYEHQKCGLQEIEYIQENKAWQGCRKNSPNKEIYKIGLLRIQEHGLNDRENRLVYAKKPVCSVHGGSFGSVNMIDFYPALLMLLYGMVLACILLLTEILHQRCEND